MAELAIKAKDPDEGRGKREKTIGRDTKGEKEGERRRRGRDRERKRKRKRERERLRFNASQYEIG
jgi:hypothetical protein